MQGAFAKKKEEQKPELQHAPKVSPFDSSMLLSGEKKAPSAPPPAAPSMSEGPMLLKESQSVEQHGRASFEKSVKAELDAMKSRLEKLRAKKKKARKRREKRRERK
ncbi:MAG: hypothetical protein WC717_04685 [Candidatus Micrarchaeia archaeon]|jgi:hypothetical protein